MEALAIAGAALLAIVASVAWIGIHGRLTEKLYGPDGRGGLSAAMGIEDLSWVSIRQVAPDGIPPDVTLCLIGDARAFWYPLPMARLRYRTVFDVRNDAPDLVGAWSEPTRPGNKTWLLVDPAELSAWPVLTGTCRHYRRTCRLMHGPISFA